MNSPAEGIACALILIFVVYAIFDRIRKDARKEEEERKYSSR